MRGSRFRHRVTIQQPVEAQDPITGAVTVTWSDVKTAEPAEVLTGPGREFLQDGAMQSDTAARITIRWFDGLSQKMRILWDGKTYNIKTFTIDRTGRRFYMIECGDEGVNEG